MNNKNWVLSALLKVFPIHDSIQSPFTDYCIVWTTLHSGQELVFKIGCMLTNSRCIWYLEIVVSISKLEYHSFGIGAKELGRLKKWHKIRPTSTLSILLCYISSYAFSMFQHNIHNQYIVRTILSDTDPFLKKHLSSGHCVESWTFFICFFYVLTFIKKYYSRLHKKPKITFSIISWNSEGGVQPDSCTRASIRA
jgi:hypothetical protein